MYVVNELIKDRLFKWLLAMRMSKSKIEEGCSNSNCDTFSLNVGKKRKGISNKVVSEPSVRSNSNGEFNNADSC